MRLAVVALFLAATAVSGLPVAERAPLTVDGLGMAPWSAPIRWTADGTAWALDAEGAHLRLVGLTVDPTQAVSARLVVAPFPDGPARTLVFTDATGETVGVIGLGTRIRGSFEGPIRFSGTPERNEVAIDRSSGPLRIVAGAQVALEPEGWTFALSAVRFKPWAADWWAWRTKR